MVPRPTPPCQVRGLEAHLTVFKVIAKENGDSFLQMSINWNNLFEKTVVWYIGYRYSNKDGFSNKFVKVVQML